MKKILCILIVLIWGNAHAQTSDTAGKASMNEAWQYLNGILKPLDPAKAFGLYLKNANGGNAQAMNAVGMQYKLGLGIDTNQVAAFGWFEKAAKTGYARAWFNLGLMYKYGSGTALNYERAYDCFAKASEMQEPTGWYGQGYMLYKGLGCTQNYKKAVSLFKKGASAGRPSSMYFLGLCYRNSYGIEMNTDSAHYWLAKASSLDYQFAQDELVAKEPENSSEAGELIQKIKATQPYKTPGSNSLNRFRKAFHNLPASGMEGSYEGYVIKYDYSGRYVISASRLRLELEDTDGTLSGLWMEDDSFTVALKAIRTVRGLLFKNMQISRTDHYHSKKPVLWSFENARLEISKSGDTVYLSGNLQLFSPDTKEPEKPLYIALIRATPCNKQNTEIKQSKIDIQGRNSLNIISSIKAVPNPFAGSFNLYYNIKQTGDMQVQLFNQGGQVVYNNTIQGISSGSHMLSIPGNNLPAGAYTLKLYLDGLIKTILVVKQ